MGFFSSIGNIFSDVADTVLKPVSSALGLASSIGGFFGGETDAQKAAQQQANAALQTNAQNIAEAQRNRDWQTHMSNTAHQREMEDLTRAGLNPILTAMGGSGASTPTGGIAHLENPYAGYANTMNEAKRINQIQKQQVANEQKRIDNETDLKNASVRKMETEVDTLRTQQENYLSSTALNVGKLEEALASAYNLDKQTETQNFLQKVHKATALERQEQAGVHSAQQQYIKNQTGLSGYDLNEREILHQFKRYTGPAKEVSDTAQGYLDLFKIWLPKPGK